MPTIRPATRADLARLHPVIERAYRGEASKVGWASEAHLNIPGTRTDIDTLLGLVDRPDSCLLIAEDGDTLLGCVHIESKGDGLAYLGLLCIDPLLQAAGLGKQLIREAEDRARDIFDAHRMEMTVITVRDELIAYYERRGYARTGELRPFPVPMDPPLFLGVLDKPL